MKMERYTRILDLHKRLIQNNCHIIFDKGALLKDNRNDKNILQLQFLNIGNKQVKAVYVAIECLGIEDELLETVDFEYLDLVAKYGDIFGSNIPVILNNSSCRKFNFGIRKILYEDSSVMLDGEMEELPVYDDLSDLGDLRDQFVREIKAIDYRIKPVIKPTESQWCWHCTCGNVNYSENEKCGKCKINKEKLFSILDVEYLSEKNKVFLENEENKRRIEAENIALKKGKIKRSIKKSVTVSAAFIAIGIAIYFLSVCLIIPHAKFKRMLSMIEEGKYKEGYRSFLEIRNIPLTSDEIELVYDFGNKCIENNEYEYAMKFFSYADGYENSKKLYCKSAYLYGIECMDNNEYIKAIENFKLADGYEDAEQKIVEARYLRGKECFINGEYRRAVEHFELISDYEDVSDKINEAKYLYVKCYFESWNSTTRLYLEELKEIGYKDTKQLYNDLYY